MPGGVSFTPRDGADATRRPTVVYLPSCASRTMGPSCDDPGTEALPNKTAALLDKAGYHVVYPKGLANLCCGQPFESKGLPEVADRKSAEVGEALREISGDGDLPIVSDTCPCSYRLQAEAAGDTAAARHRRSSSTTTCWRGCSIRKRPGAVALHVACSAKKMGLGAEAAGGGQRLRRNR